MKNTFHDILFVDQTLMRNVSGTHQPGCCGDECGLDNVVRPARIAEGVDGINPSIA